jgi:hypothetical protein
MSTPVRVHGSKGQVFLGGGTPVNEVQTITLTESAAMSGGTLQFGITNLLGAVKWVTLTWNATFSTALASLNASILSVLGVQAATVTSNTNGWGTTNFDLIFTFSGTGYLALPQKTIQCYYGAGTNVTGVSVVRTTSGKAGNTRLYIQGWDGEKSVERGDATTNADNGATNVTAGNRTFKGNVTCLWDKSRETEDTPTEVVEGDSVVLQLYPSDGDGEGYWQLTALVLTVPITVSRTATVGWKFSFENQGDWEWVKRTA